MNKVTLRPPRSVGVITPIIVAGDLAFLALPVYLAHIHYSAVLVAVFGVMCVASAGVCTYFGSLGLRMRVEVGPDAVRIYYFKPRPIVIPRDAILDVEVGYEPRGGYHRPHLILAGGGSKLVGPLTGRTEAQADRQVEKLRKALREVAPDDDRRGGWGY